jgi:hypothetical protein
MLNGLKDEGVNIQRILKKPFLKKSDLDDSDSYIPNILLEEILVNIKRDFEAAALAFLKCGSLNRFRSVKNLNTMSA